MCAWFLSLCLLSPHSGQLRTQKLKVPSGESTELKRSLYEALSGSIYIAIHAALTAGDFFLVSAHSPAFFPKPLPIFPVLAVANTWFLCRPV